MSEGELLFYGGIGLIVAAVLGGVIAAVALRLCGKRLHSQLEKEFGRRRH